MKPLKKQPQKHLHLARRKMGHIVEEIYTALIRGGGEEVQLRICREEEGLRLYAQADFLEVNRRFMERMGEVLQPPVRNSALVQEFWELAGGDQYTTDSELNLVGHMVDDASLSIEGNCVNVELFVSF